MPGSRAQAHGAQMMALPDHGLSICDLDQEHAAQRVNVAFRRLTLEAQRPHEVRLLFLGTTEQRLEPSRLNHNVVLEEHDVLALDPGKAEIPGNIAGQKILAEN